MQIADASAKQAARAAAMAAIASLNPSKGRVMSQAARWAIGYLASSTQLSDSKLRQLINLIAQIDQYNGGDPKLIRDVIAIAKMMEAQTPFGSYRQHSFKELEDMYWDARNTMTDKGFDGTSSTSRTINDLIAEISAAPPGTTTKASQTNILA